VITWMHRMSGRLGAIALLAVLVRAVLPAGFMLAEADTRIRPLSSRSNCAMRMAACRRLSISTHGKIMDAPVKGQASNDQPPCVFCASVVAMASSPNRSSN